MIYQAIILVLIIILAYTVYKIYSLQKWIKNFSPIVYTNETNVVQIGKCEVFTQQDENALSINKDILKLFLKQIDYRIASYTTIQNTCYQPSDRVWDQVIYKLKTDSEKWMETWRMNGYIDIRADIEHLIAKETPTK